MSHPGSLSSERVACLEMSVCVLLKRKCHIKESIRTIRFYLFLSSNNKVAVSLIHSWNRFILCYFFDQRSIWSTFIGLCRVYIYPESRKLTLLWHQSLRQFLSLINAQNWCILFEENYIVLKFIYIVKQKQLLFLNDPW